MKKECTRGCSINVVVTIDSYLLFFVNGADYSIIELANLIKEEIKYKGKFIFNKLMPDGTKQKLLDSSLMEKLGWVHSTEIKDGIKKTYDYFLKEINKNDRKYNY